MGQITIHSAVGNDAVVRFTQGIHEAVAGVAGSFAAWLSLEGATIHVHIEEPGRKEALGNIVETWKRSVRFPQSASVEEVREGIARLLEQP